MSGRHALPDQHVPSPEDAREHLLDGEEQDMKVPVNNEHNPQPEEPVVAEIVEEPVEATPEALGLELPDDEDEARALLLRELAEARRDADEYLENLRRLAAEFENYRRRVERDQVENVKRASERLVANLLPVLDSFEAALATEPQSDGEAKLLEGMRSTYQQLIDVLAKEGLEPIPAVGEPFDPAVHEAVLAPPGGGEDLVVTEELRRGYRMHGKVLRPALVKVDHADHA